MKRTFLLFVYLVCTSCGADAKAKSGEWVTVRRVLDGDTVSAYSYDKGIGPYKVRLQGIDCPETDQPYGSEATARLESLIALTNGVVYLVSDGQDKYGRTLGTLYIPKDGKWLSLDQQLVVDGSCWHYKQYSKDLVLAASEKKARDAKRGLWGLPGTPQAPWDYRHAKRGKSKQTNTSRASRHETDSGGTRALCCDGETSPSCGCGGGRGCCSWHGGVCGCTN